MRAGLTIRNRFLVLGLVVLVAFAALIAIGGRTLSAVMVGGPHYRAVVADKDLFIDIAPPSLYVVDIVLLAHQATLAESPDERAAIARRIEADSAASLARYAWWKANVVDPESRLKDRLLVDAHREAEEYLRVVRSDLIPLLRATPFDREQAVALLRTLDSVFARHRRAIDDSMEILSQRIRRMEADANAAAEEGNTLALWITLGALLVIAAAGVLLMRSVLRSIRRVKDRMRQMAEGDADLTARLAASSNDEVGELARWVNAFLDKIAALVRTVKKSSIQLRATATQMAATSRSQESTVAAFGASTTEVAAATKEISATGSELSATMSAVDRVAKDSAAVATEGRDALGGMRETMGSLSQSSGQISQRLSAINEKARDITGVVTTITKVADQTNLLSVNAAIEAEKAGEYGRGFLVVAREIRRLSDQTASATLDIERTVHQMQSAVSAGVMEMDKFSEQVRRSVAEVEAVGDRLDRIIGQVHAMTGRFAEVHEGMRAQAQGAQQINDAMGTLADHVVQTRQSLGEFTSAADEMKDAAESLKQELARFKMED
jgi:methyl-accepting chemotaxis protein WspA